MDKTIEILTRRIKEAASRAGRSEAKLQGEVDYYLREALNNFGIDYDPKVNESLFRSYSVSGRPDSLFGYIVLDYKAPGVLASSSGLKKAKKQVVDDYLKPISTINGIFDEDKATKLVGILIDGRSLTFATFDGISTWLWTPVREINRYTVATLLQYYRALYRKPLDSHLLSADFGRNTPAAKECIKALAYYIANPNDRTVMLFKEWKRMFEQVSTFELDQLPSLASWADELDLPCKDDPASILFVLHTYYALIVKLLAVELVTASRQLGLESFLETLAHSTDSTGFYRELQRLENGEVFRDLGVTNFLEGDFFLWYLSHFDSNLEHGLRNVIDIFRNYEPATPKLSPNRCKDLLKVFYSSIIDEQIRHDLGEYYTPDWLADLVLNRTGYSGQLEAKLIDTTCGSGTFLVLAIQRFIQNAIKEGLSSIEIIDHVISQIKGFDLNPLAVISARANYLLVISEYLSEYGSGIEIPVYLCDCINIPVQKTISNVPCLVYTLDTELGERKIALPEYLVQFGDIGKVLLQAEKDIENKISSEEFIKSLYLDPTIESSIDSEEEAILKEFYLIIQEFEEKDWDQIWCRIVKNHFASQTIYDVDFIVGNPPWVRWSRLPRGYRNRCKSFCNNYGLVSGRGYTGGIESDISTVVMYSSIDNWLKPCGIIGFLITATVYKSDSATGFRNLELPDKTPLFPLSIDDLVSLQPFPDAQNETSLIVAKKGKEGISSDKIYPETGIPYLKWTKKRGTGRIETWYSLEDVNKLTDRTQLYAVPIANRGSPLFTGTQEDMELIKPFKGNSEYIEFSHKGTTTDLSRVYWVKLLDYDRTHNLAKIRSLTLEEFGAARINNINLTNGTWIDADLLFPLIRGKDVGRFSFKTKGWYILVPNKHYDIVENEADFRRKYRKTYDYLSQNQDLLTKRSTYRRYQKHLPFYVIYDVGSYTFSSYKVVWLEQQNPQKFRSCVISEDFNTPISNKFFVPDHKLYMLSLDDENEAHFVCGVLNSTHIRRILGGFLASKQIGTSIFRYVGLSKYDANNNDHRAIAEISKKAHSSRHDILTADDLDNEDQRRLDELVKKIFEFEHT